MRYHARKDTIYTMTKYERMMVERLRKISILKELPFEKWTNWELQNLIDEYEIYFRFCRCKETPVSLYEFLYKGIYEKLSLDEELKPTFIKSNEPGVNKIKSIKLKK